MGNAYAFGRIYNPPLQRAPHFVPIPYSLFPPYGGDGERCGRRGCGGNRRPARADIKSAPTGAHAAVFVVGGALHMRPCRTAGSNRPPVIVARSRRHVGMPPYGTHRTSSLFPIPSSLPRPGGPGLRAGQGVWYDRCNLIRRRPGWIYRLARSVWRPTGLR